MSERFVSVGRHTASLLPPSIQEWLPEDHLARFVVEIVARGEGEDFRQWTTDPGQTQVDGGTDLSRR